MSNAIIKQQGDFPMVADNVWHIRAGAGTFILGMLTGAVGAAAMMRARNASRAAKPPTPRDWPIAFIHRGGAAVVPEDTILGFREGLKYGDAVIECDVHSTLDGELVVMHDETVDRTTDGTGRINELSYAEIQQLDAGYDFTTDNGATYAWRGRGVTVPTLSQIYAEFPDRPVNIEIKKGDRPGVEERVAAAIEAAGAQSRTLVVSQSRATIQRFREVSNHQVATATSTLELLGYWLLSLLHLTWLIDPPFQALQPPEYYKGIPIVTPRLVRAAHRQNLRVDVWTIDEEADMRRLLSYGVDGIMTDRPDVLARVLGHQPEVSL
ncbi:MAG TPA: glycerophosphodiester phosphodiesterase [Propionibacteriaceae bacterium]|nr:glycerophosphodiester phosphodiesterase [Propionibacteriaceae bacterium]